MSELDRLHEVIDGLPPRQVHALLTLLVPTQPLSNALPGYRLAEAPDEVVDQETISRILAAEAEQGGSISQSMEALTKSTPRLVEERSFQRELEWLAQNRHRFPGQWIAIEGGQLLAAGPVAREVYQQVAAHDPPPLVIRVEPDDLPFAGW